MGDIHTLLTKVPWTRKWQYNHQQMSNFRQHAATLHNGNMGGQFDKKFVCELIFGPFSEMKKGLKILKNDISVHQPF